MRQTRTYQPKLTLLKSKQKRGAALFSRLIRTLLVLAILALLALYAVPYLLDHVEAKNIYKDPNSVPTAPVAIVLGAAVYPDGSLSPVLQGRVDAGLELYKMHKVQKLLMSGDNSTSHYDEPSAMKRYAVAHGALPQDVIRDYAGLHTYDTCYRAGHVFGVTKAVFVSQAFHLPRAIFLAHHLGINACGFAAADNMSPNDVDYFQNRERLTTLEALLELITHHQPKYAGPPEPPLIPNSDPNR